MSRPKRLIAGIVLAMICAPGTWLRSEVPKSPTEDISVTKIAGANDTSIKGWTLEGIWHAEAYNLMFGGFSAMFALQDDTLRAFSDRGTRFTLTEPDQPSTVRNVVRQLVQPGRAKELWDIESATRDPETGAYWLGFENVHTVHRFTVASEIDGLRDLDDEVDWTINSGAEAMVRLTDGRFVILPEGSTEGLIFAGDPVSGVESQSFTYRNPAYSHAATDMAQLPDGRVLVLLRNLDFGWHGWPPFESKLAIGAPPQAGEEWAPEITLDLAGVVPRENYEGLAIRPRADGKLTVWLVSDDNLSAFQRTLLVKLTFDPEFEEPASDESQTKQKARK
ncbi:esterase-like activity of phytase family protein [uncultured Erythrobacter sp.]|uniref:esterase-like activity of phytase family protein n=1 Tax=uncultured Erythrobacter sp. TaxID=263913 RepID=UPI002614A579|nr:esterase-like activity of phytase family protein [uncultured Erythrobacter sp.]